MKEIGGYFELEIQPSSNKLFDEKAVFVNSGRNAFEYVIRSLPKIEKIWMPYYTCSSLQEPISRLKLKVEYYHINNQLEIANIEDLVLGENDYLLYTNYFGVKNKYTDFLQEEYSNNLIVDNSQALFYPPTRLCFYSPRKFVGIPDGGVAFSPFKYEVNEQNKSSYLRCAHLLKRYDYVASEGYEDFKRNSKSIKGEPLQLMSNLTRKLLESIDFDIIKIRRMQNFVYLHSILGENNKLKITLDDIVAPMVYPYITDEEFLRDRLIQNKIYIATYWPTIFNEMEKNSFEYQVTKNLIPFPIDQRYNEEDMKKIIEIYKKDGER